MHSDFEDTELACSVVQFPLVGIDRSSGEAMRRSGPDIQSARSVDRTGADVALRRPDVDPKAARRAAGQAMAQRADQANAEQRRQELAVQAAYRNGQQRGYEEGFRAGAPYQRIVGAFYALVVVGLIGGALVLLVGKHASRLW